jgi:chemotaxis protein MotB
VSAEERPPIIVKRIKRVVEGAHGGAWKIAYADFVTAMMAFFLLMWLIGSTAKGDLEGIAEYFKTPLKVALQGGSGSGDSSSVIQGGGTDLTRTTGQRKQGEKPPERRTINLQAAQAELERQEQLRLRDLKGKLEAAIEANATLSAFRRQLRIDLVPDGLRVQIVDEQNRPMFDSGSATLKGYTREILREIAKVINTIPNRISLSGHTDAAKYAGGERGYSNWELSADRANASRRELIGGGIADDKILRVVGVGPASMLDKADPYNPINRRISIIVLNQKAEERIRGEGMAEPSQPTGSAPTPEGAPAPVSSTAGALASAPPGPAPAAPPPGVAPAAMPSSAAPAAR